MVHEIFIDANFFIALFNQEDSLHAKALEISQKMQENEYALYTSNYVLAECYAVIARKCGRNAVIDFKTYLIQSNALHIVWIHERDDQKIWGIFIREENSEISYVDASNLALMKLYLLASLLTFDKNLQKAAQSEKIALFQPSKKQKQTSAQSSF